MNTKLSLTFLLFLTTVASSLFAQTWQSVYSTPEVEIYERMDTVNDTKNGVIWEFYNFKYVNKTSNNLALEWAYNLYIDDICHNCNSDFMGEYATSLMLAPNQEYICDPMSMTDRRRVINRSMIDQNSQVITAYAFRDFTVSIQ